jgi:hypothetical protein
MIAIMTAGLLPNVIAVLLAAFRNSRPHRAGGHRYRAGPPSPQLRLGDG